MQVIILMVLCCSATIVNSASKYYDGPIRPYEFGYNIEGNQHRHEKKDENGIIMGEFGFITADGVYHVTVYATDENGNFKIISMKNIKIGLPGESLLAKANPSAMSSATTMRALPSITKPPFQPQSAKKPRPSSPPLSCSSCLIPNSQQDKNGAADTSSPQGTYDGRNSGGSSRINSAGKTKNGVQPSKGTSSSSSNLLNSLSKKTDGSTSTAQGSRPSPGLGSSGQLSPTDRTKQQQQGQVPPGNPGGRNSIDVRTSLNGKKSFGQGQQQQPSAGGSQVSTPSLNGDPPQGKSVGEGGGLLYKFNYTVGYHGHHEQGDEEGVKDGGYHFVGRDGLRRNIDYLANEFGYQPYLKLERADDKDVPKEETEKEAGLKGYEFIWFNRPQ